MGTSKSKVLLGLFCLVFLLCLQAAPAWSSDYQHYTATQFLFKVIPNEGLSLGRGWELYNRFTGVYIPRYNFSQLNCYLGVRHGTFFVYGGNALNWRGQDPLMLGVIEDYPVGRFLLSTELNVMPHPSFTDYYNWSGVDFNFNLRGKPAWVGVQAETLVMDGLSNTEAGCRFGWNVYEAALYVGDKGWDARFVYTWRP